MIRHVLRRFALATGLLLAGAPSFSAWPPPAAHAQAPARAPARRGETALDRYVRRPDPAYRFTLVETRPGPGHTAYLLEMISQRWLTTAEVDKPEWRHWLTIIRPTTVTRHTGLVFVTGGATNRRAPEKTDSGLADIAVTTQSVVAELRMIPNQPLVFANDKGRERSEDEIIAYTWDKFLRTGDEKWPLRLPMTKAVVRAMDTVTAFLARADRPLAVDRFVVSGASKRGWATWTTAAVDPRVVAIVPIVIDVLNVEPSFDHHWRAYGFYAPAVKDYEDHGIMDWLGTTANRALMQIEDPYEYRDRLTMPKYLVNSTGDQFFLPDSWRFYYGDLKGETHVRYVPNTDHALKGSDALASVGAYYHAIVSGTKRPAIAWEASGNRIRVTSDTPAQTAVLWQAHNPGARDFRLETLGPVFKSTPLSPTAPGVYEATLDTPASGWTAGLIELRFRTDVKYPFVFTSGVAVTPGTLPFPPKARSSAP
jgi:PhoPQ-activated pathogenicity-related protein